MDNLVDVISDKLLDETVDSAFDSIKNKGKFSTTYVWTAINKETCQGNLVNITFINKFGKRQRVGYERLEEFCINNYVSNLVVENGKPKMLGCTLNELPNFKLDAYGNYTLQAKYTEDYIYNKALAYIQSQERKIAEDYNNGCLKGNNSKTELNVSGNISAIRDISKSAATVATGAATTAAIAGVGAAAGLIYRAINKKSLTQAQLAICNQLGKIENFIYIMSETKRETNNDIRQNKLCDYSNKFEAKHNYSGVLVNEMINIGILGCINKTNEMLNQCVSKAQANKLLTTKLSVNTSAYGTIQDYINSLASQLNMLRQEHDVTKQLVNSNIQDKRNKQQLQINKQNLISSITQMLESIDNNIENYRNIIYTSDNIVSLYEQYIKNDLKQQMNNVNINIKSLGTCQEQQDFYDILDLLNNESKNIENNITIEISNYIKNIQDEMQTLRNNIESLISDAKGYKLDRQTYTNNKNNLENNYSNIINKIDKLIAIIEQVDKSTTTSLQEDKQRLIEIHSKFDKDKWDLERGISDNEKQQLLIKEIQDTIDKYTSSIKACTKENSAIQELKKFRSIINSQISMIKSIDTRNKVDLDIKNAIQHMESLIDELKNRIIQEEKDNIALRDKVLQQISDEITRVSGLDTKTNSDWTIIDYEASINNIKKLKIDYNEIKILNNKASELNKILREKKAESKKYHDRQSTCKKNLDNELNSIESKIITLKKFNINQVEDKLNTIKLNSYYMDLETNKDEIDNRIEQLKNSFEIKKNSIQDN